MGSPEMSLSPKRCHNKIGWPRRWPFVCNGGAHVRNLRKQYLAAVLRVHVCLAHSSSQAVISSHSMGIGRSMCGHFQVEFERTAPVTACRPCSDRIANAMCDCDVPPILSTLFPHDHCWHLLLVQMFELRSRWGHFTRTVHEAAGFFRRLVNERV